MKFETLIPGSTDRVLLVGQTGSGKTKLAKLLLQSRRYVVVLDTKSVIYWEGYKRFTELKRLLEAKESHLIYAPNYEELQDAEILNDFFRFIYLRRNTTLYVDEAFDVTTSYTIPKFYHACVSRGRQRNIETWTGSQRPSGLGQILLSEAENYYVFRLQLEADSKKVESITGIAAESIRRLPKREFFFFNLDKVIGPNWLKLN
jgi:adenylate kinase family enzyme